MVRGSAKQDSKDDHLSSVKLVAIQRTDNKLVQKMAG